MSLAEAEMPTCLKETLVCSLIQKSSLDKDLLKNYRPVSNLPLLSKVVVKVVSGQLLQHLDGQNTLEPLQSAYRKNHSTEMVLLSVCTEINTALDNRQSTWLVLWDLSSAFDAFN